MSDLWLQTPTVAAKMILYTNKIKSSWTSVQLITTVINFSDLCTNHTQDGMDGH